MARNRPWETAPQGRRREGQRARRRVLIICEDTKSSCYYFRRFPCTPDRAEIITLGMGMNTDTLVEEAIRLQKQASANHQPYSAVWCLLDRDSFPLEDYARAFDLAETNNIRMAWANEAFELWYLLHFNYHDTGISRHDYKGKLERCLNGAYDKADKEIYAQVVAHQPTAIKNAQRLEKYLRKKGFKYPERENPSTSVHKLVLFLNELGQLGPVLE